MIPPVLMARQVVRRYGGITAVDQVDLDLPPAHITALIGPNGAGKTTLFHCLSGYEFPDAGSVWLGAVDVTRQGSDRRARHGLARTFQQIAAFPTLTVEENLLVGAENRTGGEIFRGLLGLPSAQARRSEAVVDETLLLLGLAPVRGERAGDLSTGALRLVELGRALCTKPHVLLLDEPASGLDDEETANLAGLLRRLVESGMAVLLVEHDLGLVFDIADSVHVMAAGRIISSGTPEQVRADPQVRASYLGELT
jgi:branched-chain amino acid transport system ATP-binding protein